MKERSRGITVEPIEWNAIREGARAMALRETVYLALSSTSAWVMSYDEETARLRGVSPDPSAVLPDNSVEALFRGSREEFLAFLARSMGDMVTHHFVGNALFALDGDRAEGEVYTINYHVIGTDERRDYVAGGRYLDQYQRHAGRWVFMKRQRLVDWAHEGPTADAGVAAALSRGVAGPADPSFAVLPGLARLRQSHGPGG